MRSTIVLRDGLLEEARAATGLKTKREILELALEELVRRRRLDNLRARLGTMELDVTPADIERWRAEDPVA